MRPCKVLIVEDEIPMREQLRLFPWQAHGFELTGEAKNGVEALTKYGELQPDIVLTDIAMPFMDGLELMRQLKAKQPEAQVILLTCHNQFDYVREALLMGACDYLMKGAYQDADLLAALNRARDKLGDTLQPEPEPFHRYEVQQAARYIEAHLHLPISLNEVAEHVDLSPNYFGIVFRRETGSYFQDYVKKQRMDQAAYLLKHSSLKIYEIAERVGMMNYRYFTDVFTKHFGIGPREYRGSGV